MKWWFIALMIISLISLVAFFVFQRFRYFIAMDRLKNNLAADLHDNIGAGLTEISILSEIASHEINKPDLATKHLAQVSELSRNLVDVMSDIVWVVNPKQDSLYDLIVRLKDSYGEILQQLEIKLVTSNLEKLNSIRLPLEQRQNIYLIFKEALNNSIKHSKCSEIKIDIIIERSKITISLEDNGLGFDEKKSNLGNGLVNIKNRAKKINGKVSINSEKNIGTKITFKGTIK
jgi:signal transduction histidine kinase